MCVQFSVEVINNYSYYSIPVSRPPGESWGLSAPCSCGTWGAAVWGEVCPRPPGVGGSGGRVSAGAGGRPCGPGGGGGGRPVRPSGGPCAGRGAGGRRGEIRHHGSS